MSQNAVQIIWIFLIISNKKGNNNDFTYLEVPIVSAKPLQDRLSLAMHPQQLS
jgi:hypothetical protein